MTPQVLVVGAGPVGLTMAAELVRYGVSVRIVDKAAQRTDKSKALVLWSRTLELLDRAGCADTFVAAGQSLSAANIIASDKLIARIDFDHVDSPYPYALMLPQSETERLLEEHLNRLGTHVERQLELISISQSEASVTAILRHPDGHDEVLESGWLIGCDGAHSTVRHSLGLHFLGQPLQSSWVLADVHLAGMRVPATELAIYWHEDGVLALFPFAPGRYRVIADITPKEGAAPGDPTLTQIQDIVAQRGPGGLAVSDPVWLSSFRINERMVQDYRSGRIFVAGDAAHVHSPAGGQGMNTGMQDAFNLGWKLALVCRGCYANQILLDSYSKERSAIGAQVLAASSRMTALAVMKNHTAQTLRNLLGHLLFGVTPVRRAMADTLTEVSVGYAKSPLNGPEAPELGGPAPGERAAPIKGQDPVGAGNVPRFALFAGPGHAIALLLHGHQDVLDPVLRPPFRVGGAWLVRPDGYTAAVARDSKLSGISDYLRNLLLHPVR